MSTYVRLHPGCLSAENKPQRSLVDKFVAPNGTSFHPRPFLTPSRPHTALTKSRANSLSLLESAQERLRLCAATPLLGGLQYVVQSASLRLDYADFNACTIKIALSRMIQNWLSPKLHFQKTRRSSTQKCERAEECQRSHCIGTLRAPKRKLPCTTFCLFNRTLPWAIFSQIFTMYFLYELERTITLHPSFFGPRVKEYLTNRLLEDVEGTCTGQYYIICVMDAYDISEGRVVPGSAVAEYTVHYRAVVWRPFKGETVGYTGGKRKASSVLRFGSFLGRCYRQFSQQDGCFC